MNHEGPRDFLRPHGHEIYWLHSASYVLRIGVGLHRFILPQSSVLSLLLLGLSRPYEIVNP